MAGQLVISRNPVTARADLGAGTRENNRFASKQPNRPHLSVSCCRPQNWDFSRAHDMGADNSGFSFHAADRDPPSWVRLL
jgi:hypothetical protein